MDTSEWIHLSGDSCVKMPEMSVQRMDQRRGVVPPRSLIVQLYVELAIKIMVNDSKILA